MRRNAKRFYISASVQGSSSKGRGEDEVKGKPPSASDVELVPSWKADEAIDEVQAPSSNAYKILRNGQLLILRDGIEYDLTGRPLTSNPLIP